MQRCFDTTHKGAYVGEQSKVLGATRASRMKALVQTKGTGALAMSQVRRRAARKEGRDDTRRDDPRAAGSRARPRNRRESRGARSLAPPWLALPRATTRVSASTVIGARARVAVVGHFEAARRRARVSTNCATTTIPAHRDGLTPTPLNLPAARSLGAALPLPRRAARDVLARDGGPNNLGARGRLRRAARELARGRGGAAHEDVVRGPS